MKKIYFCLIFVVGLFIASRLLTGPLEIIGEVYMVNDSTINRLRVVEEYVEIPVYPGSMRYASWDTTKCLVPGIPVKVVNKQARYCPGLYIMKEGKPVEVSRVFRVQNGGFSIISKQKCKSESGFVLREVAPDTRGMFSLGKRLYKSLYRIVHKTSDPRLYIDR